MTVALRRVLPGLLLALACLPVIAQETISAARLQRLLQASARPSMAFQEVRESPWLPAPLRSSGTLHWTPQALEKRIESPRPETWRLLADRIEWLGPGGAERKQLQLSQAPALAMLSDVLRHVVAGDLDALERDFRIELHGSERAWRAQLRPRNANVARYLDGVELQGTAGQLQVIAISERSGERTTTRLLP